MLDATDIAILKALNHNSRIKISHLAQQVHLTAPAVTARMTNLEQRGAIKAYTIEAGLAEMGYDRQVFIQVKLLATKQSAYARFIKANRNTLRHHYQTTGDLNYLIEGAFTTRATLKQFLDQLSHFATYRVIDILAEEF